MKSRLPGLSAATALIAIAPALLHAQQPVLEQEPDSVTEYQRTYEETATLFPIRDYGGDLWTRGAMTGDWGGARTAIAEDGLQFVLDVNQFYQGIMSGGRDTGWEYNGSADYRIQFDSGQAGLWPGGFLDVHGETYWGSAVNRATGALLPVNMDPALSAPAGNGTYLTHVQFTQFLSEKFAFTLGKIDTTVGDANAFAHGVGDRRFMNLAYSFNPVALLTTPYSTLGAGVIYFLGPQSQWNFLVYDTEGQIDESGFDTVFKGNTSFATNLQLQSNFFEKNGHHWFGFLYANGSFNSQGQDPRIFFPALDVTPATEGNTWAFIYNFDQYLVSNPDDPTQGWGLFGRFGIADKQTNIIRTFYSLGLGGTGMIPGRERDRFGVGYYYMKLSDERLGLLTDDNEQGVEVFYNMAVTPWCEISADLQVIDGAVRNTDTAVVGGIRARLVF